jgi:hypothetical protein
MNKKYATHLRAREKMDSMNDKLDRVRDALRFIDPSDWDTVIGGEGDADMNRIRAFATGETPPTHINTTNTLLCPVCGETVVIAYPGLRPHWAAVVCFAGHFQGWTPWPDWGGEEPREFDS